MRAWVFYRVELELAGAGMERHYLTGFYPLPSLITWVELAPLELNNASCVDGELGDIEHCEDNLRDDDGGSCGGSVGGIDPSF
jgi:hypothetical protein